jgi:hypothetical protein
MNYPGDVRDTVGQAVGPNNFDEYYLIKAALYDVGADKSRVEFEIIVPVEEGRVDRAKRVMGWVGKRLNQFQTRAIVIYIRTGKVVTGFPEIYREKIEA